MLPLAGFYYLTVFRNHLSEQFQIVDCLPNQYVRTILVHTSVASQDVVYSAGWSCSDQFYEIGLEILAWRSSCTNLHTYLLPSFFVLLFEGDLTDPKFETIQTRSNLARKKKQAINII